MQSHQLISVKHRVLSLVTLLGFGLLLESLGIAALAMRFEWIGRLLYVVPASAVFHAVDENATRYMSERALFWFGTFSGAIVWSAVLYLVLVFGRLTVGRLFHRG
jgi:hypothetical protein